MSTRWDRVKEVFNAALELDPSERDHFLDDACADDADLRAEVDSLLGADNRAGHFLEQSPVGTGTTLEGPALPRVCSQCNARYPSTAIVCRLDGEPLVDDPDSLVNTTLDELYRVLKVIGRGGFGVVYLAKHVLLRDLVAIKVLPKRLGHDPDRVERFLREGRASRALKHPNAVTVYDLRVSIDGTTYMVQEYVEGHTLRDEMDARGRLSADEALDLLEPIASALDEAHALGIVHRDLKPENIMIGTREGRRSVKLLDLGIAKLREMLLSTEVTRLDVTQPGQIIGTPLYMPPEQWGELPKDGRTDIDGRTDVYSLAVVAFELIGGCRPFDAKGIDGLRIAHLRTPPKSIRDTDADVPPAFESAMAKAMSKDRSDRQATPGQLCRELRTALVEARDTAPDVEPIVARRTWRHAVVAVGLIALLAAITLGAWLLRGSGTSPTPAETPPPAQALVRPITSDGNCLEAAISPDGKLVAAVVDDRSSDRLELIQLAQSPTTANAPRTLVAPSTNRLSQPTFSPDGSYVYYIVTTRDGLHEDLYRMPVQGSASQRVLSDVSTAPAFSHTGDRIAFVKSGTDLTIANVDGSNPWTLASKGGPQLFVATAPTWSPDDAAVACAVWNMKDRRGATVVAFDVASHSERDLTSTRWPYVSDVEWLADGSDIVLTAPTQKIGSHQIWQIAVSDGSVTSVTNDTSSYSSLSATADGASVLTVESRIFSSLSVSPTVEAKSSAKITAGEGRFLGAVWTPDERIVYSAVAGASANLWVCDATGGNVQALTSDGYLNRDPSVAPSGQYVYFSSNRSGPFNIWRIDADGGNPVQITHGDDDEFPVCSADGRWLVYESQSNDGGIRRLALDGSPEPETLTQSVAHWPSVSPDSAFTCCLLQDPKSGTMRISVLPIAGGLPVEHYTATYLQAQQFYWQHIRWSGDGRRLYYIDEHDGAGNVWEIARGTEGPPKMVTGFSTDMLFDYDVSRSGQLVCTRGSAPSNAVLITLARSNGRQPAEPRRTR